MTSTNKISEGGNSPLDIEADVWVFVLYAGAVKVNGNDIWISLSHC